METVPGCLEGAGAEQWEPWSLLSFVPCFTHKSVGQIYKRGDINFLKSHIYAGPDSVLGAVLRAGGAVSIEVGSLPVSDP